MDLQQNLDSPAGSGTLWRRWRPSPRRQRCETPRTWDWAARRCGPSSWWCGPAAGTYAWSWGWSADEDQNRVKATLCWKRSSSRTAASMNGAQFVFTAGSHTVLAADPQQLTKSFIDPSTVCLTYALPPAASSSTNQTYQRFSQETFLVWVHKMCGFTVLLVLSASGFT